MSEFIKSVPMFQGSIKKSGTDQCAAIDVSDAETVAITVKCKYNGSATAGITVNLFTSPNKEDWDTDAYSSFITSFTAGATIQKTVIVDVESINMLNAQIVNGDATYTVTDVKLWATRKIKKYEVD